MKFKISTIYTALLYVMLACQMLILVGHPFRIYIMISIGTWGIMLCEAVALLMIFADGKRKPIDNNKLMAVAVIAALAVFSILLTGSVGVNSLIKLLTFLQLPIFLFIATKNNNKKAKEVIYSVNMLYPIFFIACYFAPFSHRYIGEYGETNHSCVTLGYNNPNETAIYLMFSFVIVVSAIAYYKQPLLKLLSFVEACLVGFLILKTDSRAVIIICFAIVIYILCRTDIYIQPLLLSCAFIIPAFYTIMVICFPSLAYIQLMGETIENGRMIMIQEYVDNVDAFGFLFGNFEKYHLDNMHNGMLSVIASLGALACGTYFAGLYFAYKKILGSSYGGRAFIPVALGLIAVIVHSTVEAAPLISGSVFAASNYILACLCVPEKENDGSEEVEEIENIAR